MDNGLSFMKNGTPTDTCNKIQACIHHYVYFDFDYHNCPYASPPFYLCAFQGSLFYRDDYNTITFPIQYLFKILIINSI